MHVPCLGRSRRRAFMLAVPFVALGLLLTGCGQHHSDATPSPPKVAPASPATLTMRSAYPIGKILVDGNGRTLYMSETDTSSRSACLSSCVKAWPPLLTRGAPQAGGGVKGALIGTIRRPDGTTQVTYHGHPLYRYRHDLVPGQSQGIGLKELGTVWYTLSAQGDAISPDGTVVTGGSGGGY
ncbi:MAG: COG4315 family predicted lipoprotein [Sciscionella sp.]